MAYKQLTEIERYQIEALKREGFTQSAIARSLGRSRNTINREIGRNSDAKGYRGSLAVKRTARRRRGARKKIKLDVPMQSIIKSLLGEYYSPEQISGRLKLALGVEISHDPSMPSSIARSVKPYTSISEKTRRAAVISITF